MGNKPSIKCVCDNSYRCKHPNRFKWFYFFYCKKAHQSENGCKFVENRYADPGKPPMTINISVNNLSDKEIEKLLDSDYIRKMFVKFMRESVNDKYHS